MVSCQSLEEAILITQDWLNLVAQSPKFFDILSQAFGNDFDRHQAEFFRQSWELREFDQFPSIKIKDSRTLSGAKGAFASATNIIYLSEDFLNTSFDSSNAIASVLLEEIGHYIDSKLNKADSLGDEGEIFATLVQGQKLSDRHLQQLKGEDDTALITLNGQTLQVEQSAPYSGNNLGEVIDGLDQLLDVLQDAVEDQVFGTELPLLGNTLKNSYSEAVQFLKGLETQVLNKLHEKLDVAQNKTPELVQQALAEALGSNGLNLLQDLNSDNVINAQDVLIGGSTDDVTFKLKLRKDIASSTFNTSLDTDIGVPSLGLTVNGSAEAGIGYDFDLTFGVNKVNGFYFNTSNDNLKVELNAALPNLSATGNLGFLQLNITDQNTRFNGSFGVDFRDTSDRLFLSELPLVNFTELIDANLTGNADINLKFVTSFNGSAVLPSIHSDFNLDWSFSRANADPNQAQTLGTISRIGFDNTKLDLGSFFNEFTRPVLEKVQTIIEPVKPIINLLATPIDLKVAKFNLLDIAQAKGYIDQSDRNFIESTYQLIQIIDAIPSSNLLVNMGSFDLGNANIRTPNFNLSTITPGNIIAAPTVDQQLAGTSEANFIAKLNNTPGGGLQFPILSDRNQVFNLLLGKNASLFAYDMPKLEFQAEYSQFFPIIGPLGAEIKGSFGAGVDLFFGYDTEGLKQFKASGNASDIFNGFYVSGTGQSNGQGANVPEITLKVALEAYAALNAAVAKAGVGGGIAGNIRFDLKDPEAEPDGTRKVRFNEIEQLLDDPLTMFRASGEITAGLSAYLKVGFSRFGYTKRFDSPRVTLLKYGDDGSSQPQPSLATALDNAVLRLNMGPNAGNRQNGNTSDGDEVFVIRHSSGAAGNEAVSVNAFEITQSYNGVRKIVANAGQGNNIITLQAGVLANAELVGGDGNDRLTGSDGEDLLKGEDGNDTLIGGNEWDRLYGDEGNDTLSGEGGDDWLVGGAGADLLNGGEGSDTASYSTATTGISLNLTTGEATGDAARDVFQSIEQFEGSRHADTLVGSSQSDDLDGGDGNDVINGSVGDDTLKPGWGDDVVDGGDGTDLLVIDYSLLPTQAIAWRDADITNFKWDVYVANAYGIGEPIKINTNGFSYYDVTFSSDGTTVAWIDGEGLWTQKIHTSNPPIKIATHGPSSASLSGDGSKIVWIDISTDSNYYDTEIWIANTDGTGISQVTTDDAQDFEVSISSDGNKITWVRQVQYQQDGTNITDPEIFVSNSDGTDVIQITNTIQNPHYFGYGDRDRDPAISADGSKVVWQRDTGPTGVFVANTNGSGIRELSRNYYGYNRFSSISGDGSRVIWTGGNGAGYQQTGIYAANTDGSRLWLVPSSQEAWGNPSLSGDGNRVAFAKQTGTTNGGSEAIYSLFIGNLDGTEPPILIDTANQYSTGGGTWDYGSSSAVQGYVLSTYVNLGVRYPALDPSTGSGEIYTWGPSRVRFTNIERFDITGTRYGDELFGGNLEDNLTGGGGADTLKAGLGNDNYELDAQATAGSKIQDAGGTDTLKLNNITLSIAAPSVGNAGLRREGTTLLIDINKDGVANAANDLSILDFFAAGAGAGTGFIETIKTTESGSEKTLSSTTILNLLQGTVSPPPSLSITDVTIAEGNNGTTNAVFVVNLLRASNQTVTVNYATANGSAIAGSDYIAASGTLSFASGETSKTINTQITGDRVVEADEAFTVNLSSASRATILDGQGTATITNDDTTSNNLTLIGTNRNDFLVGDIGNDFLSGKRGKDRITGGAGADVIVGGMDDDVLTGSTGRDQFRFDIDATFNKNLIGIDRITDFVRGVDKIVLDKTTFKDLRQLNFASVKTAAQAQTSRALITYIQKTGALYYNQNGAVKGFGAGGQFADLINGLVLTKSDFLVSN
ncbi:hypothetical protein H6G00_16860 [Leptolyngbya sp. FACHB-541]|uniref:Calx-beta domain-containing protein n=1 Tax=Leptolyngbya sp. FACHB-541 TaxID=2692810 RepID=UPI0016897BF6|nr:Calx-beta domain-containing protein [Leptolyngbya sp. FACHB-541]MBD1998278.1 hypothetical protein [Leptolyngbya sp. FACHB-541]